VNGKDVVFQFDVPPATAKVTIMVAASYLPVMYLKKDNCTGSAIACVPGASYTMQWPAEGTYFLILDGQGADQAGEYTVKVTLE
jgi:antirestriction protein